MGKECLIALSFGMGRKKHYGKSNYRICLEMIDLNIPIIAQWEIANLLKQLGNKSIVVSVGQNEGEYLDTYAVLKKAKKVMDGLGYLEAILVGHQDHLPRIKMMAKKIGIKISNREIKANIPYDTKSTQWWTRNRHIFLSREILVYILSFLRGQI